MHYEDFKIKIVDDIAVITIDLLAATQRDAKPLWDELESKGILEWKKVIVDLSQCTFIDSTFIGMLVRIFRTMVNNGFQMKLVYPENTARPLFHTTAIIRIVNCFETLNEAIRSFDTKFPIRKISFGEEFHRN